MSLIEAAATARTAASGLSSIVVIQYRMILGERCVQLIPGASRSSLGSQFKKVVRWTSGSQNAKLRFPFRWVARFLSCWEEADPDAVVCAPDFSDVLSCDCMIPPSFLLFVPVKLTLVARLTRVLL